MSFEGLPKGSASKQRSFLESIYLVEVVKGLAVTMRHLVRNILHTDDMPTMQYPEEKRVYSERFRGRHRLMKREDGSPRCVACQMCSTYCPADCITIVADEHPDPTIEKYPGLVRHRPAALRLLRPLRGGLPLRRDPPGHRHLRDRRRQPGEVRGGQGIPAGQHDRRDQVTPEG